MSKPETIEYIAENFKNSKGDEQYYVDKHSKKEKNAWRELSNFNSDPTTWGDFLGKFKKPRNRRRAILEGSQYISNDLKNLTGWTSVATEIVKTDSEKKGFEPRAEFKALFGIIFRLPYSWVKNSKVLKTWDYQNFIELDESMNEEGLTDLLENSSVAFLIKGVTLLLKNLPEIYLRIEKRNELIIIDLCNPEPKLIIHLTRLLDTLGGGWHYFYYPTVVKNHYVMVFIKGSDETILSEFKWIRLSDIRKL
jgi:hypothetical protein